MKNLAGNEHCDSDIVRELLIAGIKIIPVDRKKFEVPYSFEGEFRGWRFSRAWYYWVATPIRPNHGLPLFIAEKLYTFDKNARVAGHCGAPSPSEHVKWIECKTGNTIVLDPSGAQFADFQRFKLSTDGLKFVTNIDDKTFIDNTGMAVEPVIDLYHIDTQEALNIFTKCL